MNHYISTSFQSQPLDSPTLFNNPFNQSLQSSKDVNGCQEKAVVAVASGEGEVGDHSIEEDESESNALLPPPRRGGMSRKSEKPRMKVRWNDSNGNNLAEILEFQPSDVSDSSDEDADACSCTIM